VTAAAVSWPRSPSGRTAFEVFLPHAGLGDLLAEIHYLYDFRLYEDERGQAPFTPDVDDVRLWLDRARTILDAVAEAIDER
jgi:hypothetical protein